jgi:hypothetical protein
MPRTTVPAASGRSRRPVSRGTCASLHIGGRFKSQALFDEAALAAGLAYVDLNPIRAGMAKTPETSDHTSIQQRINIALAAHTPNHFHQQPKGLMSFAGYPRQDMPKGLPFRLTDYLELVDWTGRRIREDKRGAIDENLPPILERLNIESKHWLFLTRHFESRFKGLVGTAYQLKRVCEKLGYQRTPGLKNCKTYFP